MQKLKYFIMILKQCFRTNEAKILIALILLIVGFTLLD